MKNFYDIFKIGIELEGEFIDDPNDYMSLWNVDDDGSLREKNSGYLKELRTEIIRSKGEESEYLNELDEMANKKGFFSYANDSCGTHIHFSFNSDEYPRIAHYVFDTKDFEKYFFKRYFKKFKLPKYARRLTNEFSASTLSFDKKGRLDYGKGLTNISHLPTIKETINKKKNKHIWLTSVDEFYGRGLELRIFPYLNSTDGLLRVINFTKKVLMSYLDTARAKKNISDLLIFEKENLVKREMILKKLNDMELITLQSTNLFNHLSEIRRGNSNHLPGEAMLLLVKIFKRNKKAFA